jgi:multidrug resistance efflux pump
MKATPRRRVSLFWLLGVALLAVSAVGAGWVIHSNAGDSPGGGGKDAAPVSGDVTTNCLGVVDLERGVVMLAPLRQYPVTEVLVGENDAVTAGTVLLRVQDTSDRSDLDKAERGIKVAEGQIGLAKLLAAKRLREIAAQRDVVEHAEKELALAQEGLKWAEGMVNKKLLTEDKVLAAKALLSRAEAQEKGEKAKLRGMEELDEPALRIKMAEEDLAVRQADLKKARYALEKCELKAPEDGVILSVTVNLGDVFTPESRQPAFVFAPNRKRIIRVEVEQEFAHRLKVGQPATVYDYSTASEPWRGKVVRIAAWYKDRRVLLPELFPSNDVRTLECIVEVDPGQAPLRIGQRVRVTLGR